jgi:hypothetical protein
MGPSRHSFPGSSSKREGFAPPPRHRRLEFLLAPGPRAAPCGLALLEFLVLVGRASL